MNELVLALPIIDVDLSGRSYQVSEMLILDTNIIAHGATTQYLNYDINSLCKFNGHYLAASNDDTSGGIVEYTGDLDNGNEISSYFITATMDFGINNDKRLRYFYISLEATDNLELHIKTEKVPSGLAYTIEVDKTLGQIQQDVRIPISRALHGRFWTFKISNTATGADFSIDEIRVLPLMRNLEH